MITPCLPFFKPFFTRWEEFSAESHSLDDIVQNYRQRSAYYAQQLQAAFEKPTAQPQEPMAQPQAIMDGWVDDTHRFLDRLTLWKDWTSWTNEHGQSLFTLFLSPDMRPLRLYLPMSFWNTWIQKMEQGDFDFAYYTLSSDFPRPPHWPQEELRFTPLHILRILQREDATRVATIYSGQHHVTLPAPLGKSVILQQEMADTFRKMLDLVLEHETTSRQGQHSKGPLLTSVEEHLLSVGDYGRLDWTNSIFGRPISPDLWFQDPASHPERSPWLPVPSSSRSVMGDFLTDDVGDQQLFMRYWQHLLQQPSYSPTPPLPARHLPNNSDVGPADPPHLGLVDHLYFWLLRQNTEFGVRSQTFSFDALKSWKNSPIAHVLHAWWFSLPNRDDMISKGAYTINHPEILQQRRMRLTSPTLDLMEELSHFRTYLSNRAFSFATNSMTTPLSFIPPPFFLPCEPSSFFQAGRRVAHMEEVEAFFSDSDDILFQWLLRSTLHNLSKGLKAYEKSASLLTSWQQTPTPTPKPKPRF